LIPASVPAGGQFADPVSGIGPIFRYWHFAFWVYIVNLGNGRETPHQQKAAVLHSANTGKRSSRCTMPQ
tara:strand:+ start:155 stop:361 length:207 start_codon:yes stop_codon:yes gene_type:complete